MSDIPNGMAGFPVGKDYQSLVSLLVSLNNTLRQDSLLHGGALGLSDDVGMSN